jgi:hypothetical protein
MDTSRALNSGRQNGWWNRVLNRQASPPRVRRTVIKLEPAHPEQATEPVGWHDSSVELRRGLLITEWFDFDPSALFAPAMPA